jgi:lipopolysaccharide biosynthesis protein
MTKKIRPIAIYLPQFHPIPENNEWWGKGFTEWTNVVKAKPKFSGHYQPHLPADLGFYDLRLPEVREAQANLARQYGVYGFCYYHYWFNGRRVLERPFQEVFESGKPDFPFMLCWANENWTRRWDGGDERVLLKQEYHEADDVKHIHTLIPYLRMSAISRLMVNQFLSFIKTSLFQTWKERSTRLEVNASRRA